jgi:hypothetical protein
MVLSGNLVKWMVTVNTPTKETVGDIGGDNMAAFKPELVISDLIKSNPGYEHYKCPAFTDALKNTYLIRAPFDLSIQIDPTTQKFAFDKNRQFVDKYIWDRRPDYETGQNMLLSINHFMLFITDSDIEVEQLPCLYHNNDWVSKTQIITGRFNINKWIRNVELAALIKDSKPNNQMFYINIKRGDPLFYLRFHAANKKQIKLEQEVDLHKILEYTEYTWATAGVKRVVPNLQLPILYKMFEKFKPKKFIKRCPFRGKG